MNFLALLENIIYALINNGICVGDIERFGLALTILPELHTIVQAGEYSLIFGMLVQGYSAAEGILTLSGYISRNIDLPASLIPAFGAFPQIFSASYLNFFTLESIYSGELNRALQVFTPDFFHLVHSLGLLNNLTPNRLAILMLEQLNNGPWGINPPLPPLPEPVLTS